VSTVLSLASVGYDFADKVEGLAVISKDIVAVLNDNDFGVSGSLDVSKKVFRSLKNAKRC
jgi:hypothetical protein